MLALVTIALLAVAGCGGSGAGKGSASTPTPNHRPDEQVRQTIAAALRQEGHPTEAGVVTAGGTRLTALPTPFLTTWKIYQVDSRQGPHPVRLHVASGGSQAVLLTGAPKAFATVTRLDGTAVKDPQTAAGLGRVYLETTRPAGLLTYVVSTVDEIRFRPGITGGDAQRRDALVGRYRPVIKAPNAVAQGPGYAVTAFVVRDRALERRDLTIGKAGTVKEKITTLAPDLPVPYTI
ncbi:hypothetical protein [Actinomadura macrotermitis]|uniref:Lipoprotein n=1 Tax=Actinomadura macrotermitis TaxID=2585200 RepID=A0A7K0BS71_9ACTN|nr:hypothetical protein [Actinomadura macrotermitis]MQY03876.1 hypothetical protein [Actinomadura macrotermitis]